MPSLSPASVAGSSVLTNWPGGIGDPRQPMISMVPTSGGSRRKTRKTRGRKARSRKARGRKTRGRKTRGRK